MKQKFAIITAILSLGFGFQSKALSQWIPTNGPSACRVHKITVTGPNLLAASDDSVFLSSDHGTSWSEVSDLETYVTAFQTLGNFLFAGSSIGIFASVDNGAKWTLVNTNFKNVSAFTAIGSTLIAGAWGDSGGIYFSYDNGINWQSRV
jgi:hypothetical protein